MTLDQMARACGGQLCNANGMEEAAIGSLYMDSRKISEGDVFVAAKGERVDGHSFIEKVYELGALCVICEHMDVSAKGPYILVSSSIQALKDISAAYRDMFDIPVVGITGSVGKTTTKEFVAAVLEKKYNILKTAGNQNNTLGLPMMVMQLRPSHKAAVLEMGISDFGEMHELSRDAKPDICVITNIGQCHLEFLHSRDGILKAKSEIFDYMSPDGTIILNGDDDKLSTISQVKGIRPVFYGLGAGQNNVKNNGKPPLSYYVSDIVSKGLFGSECIIHTPVGDFQATIPLPGIHMVYNALAATAVGISLGLGLEQIAEGLSEVHNVGGRGNIIRTQKYTLIDDCYNASPASMKGSLELLSMADTRRVAILGDMFELGEQQESLHAEVGRCVKGNADLLICAGELSRNLYEAAKEDGVESYWFEDVESLIANLKEKNILQNGDTVLVKASHGMNYSKVVDLLK